MHGVFGAGAAVDWTESLPDEMLQHIANFLDHADWIKMLGMSKRWQFALLAGLKVPKHEAVQDCLRQSDEFQAIALELTKIGYSTRALEVAKRLHVGWQQAESFFVISRELALKGETGKALEIAYQISEETLMEGYSQDVSRKLRDLRAGAFAVISQKLASRDVEQAIEVANKIEYRELHKSRAFAAIAKCLLGNGDIARAKIVTEQIGGKRLKTWTLGVIAQAEANIPPASQAV